MNAYWISTNSTKLGKNIMDWLGPKLLKFPTLSWHCNSLLQALKIFVHGIHAASLEQVFIDMN
jgi:hypothetical protein